MNHLHETVRRLVSLAGSYRPGAIIEAEQVVDTYLASFHGYRARRAAMDLLRDQLACPNCRSHNRGGLFEQVEFHLQRTLQEMVRLFQ
ncbi:hypothetical protein MKK55_25185 [Methylobacterium sp. J-059]|uniref:hypothetical protein n=1 Tax=unclassified Methylobacterium TaxID=2615210 RepID=UPI001FBBFB23|nr:MULTISPECIES: hypothetical protein [unclassified Methylobacterium]MCJ2042223.1 hypothetical protein [Methylobacterium sp. J-059]MCJ2079098.1 hypothetical protein [Methylobacterium sp. E-016]